jgi:hypothetical protein
MLSLPVEWHMLLLLPQYGLRPIWLATHPEYTLPYSKTVCVQRQRCICSRHTSRQQKA